jgi:hypothetical protein
MLGRGGLMSQLYHKETIIVLRKKLQIKSLICHALSSTKQSTSRLLHKSYRSTFPEYASKPLRSFFDILPWKQTEAPISGRLLVSLHWRGPFVRRGLAQIVVGLNRSIVRVVALALAQAL